MCQILRTLSNLYKAGEEILESRINNIKLKLNKLIEYDINLDVFGASSHKYNFTKVSEAEIIAFENEYSITLPDEFRTFLLEVGCGAGPYYGIYSFEKMRREINDWKDFLNKANNLNGSFKFNNKDTSEYIELKKNGVKGYFYKILSSIEGWIPICHQGCTYYSILVLNGDQKGKVWSMNEEAFQILPEKVIREVSFYDWFEEWLDEGLSKEFQPKELDILIQESPEKVKSISFPVKSITVEKVFECRNIESLSLYNMGLEKLPKVESPKSILSFLSKKESKGIENLIYLRTLFLSGNKLECIPTELSKLENLWYLDLGSNGISEVPEKIPLPKNLENLNLRSNKFSDFPIGIVQMEKLKELELQNNQICDITCNIENMKSLRHLNISNNKFKCIPKKLSKLQNLKSIDITNNEVTHICENNDIQFSIRSLSLSKNPIKDFSSISCIKDVLKIELNNCNLQYFPEEIITLQNIKMLELYGNQIKELPEKLVEMKSLVWFNLSQNIFEDLEKCIDILSRMRSLRELTLPYTVIHEFPKNIVDLSFLDALYLKTYLPLSDFKERMKGYDIDSQDSYICSLFPNTYVSIN